MVRLRVKRATAYLEETLSSLMRKTESAGSVGDPASESAPLYFSDEELDKLFNFLKPGG
jgi:hypothetical protein